MFEKTVLRRELLPSHSNAEKVEFMSLDKAYMYANIFDSPNPEECTFLISYSEVENIVSGDKL